MMGTPVLSERLGTRYRLEQVLYDGRAGCLYAARNVEANMEALVSVFTTPPLLPGEGDALIRALRRLHMPGIVPPSAYELLPDQRALYATDHWSISSLAGALEASTDVLPALDALTVVRKLAVVLQAVAEQGWHHNHLTPHNILIDHEGEVLIANLGVPPLGLADPQSAVYLAPELLREGATAGEAQTVYALGAILYALLIGRDPVVHPAGQNGASAAAIPPLAGVRRGLARTTYEVVDAAVELDPERRTPTLAAFIDQLDAAFDAEYTWPRRIAAGIAAHPVRAAAVVALIALLAFVLWLRPFDRTSSSAAAGAPPTATLAPAVTTAAPTGFLIVAQAGRPTETPAPTAEPTVDRALTATAAAAPTALPTATVAQLETPTAVPPTPTPSPVPSPTPLPTATQAAASAFVRVTTPAANVRSGPGLEFSSIGVVQFDQQLRVVGRAPNFWYNVELPDGGSGWLSPAVTEPVSPAGLVFVPVIAPTRPPQPTAAPPTATRVAPPTVAPPTVAPPTVAPPTVALPTVAPPPPTARPTLAQPTRTNPPPPPTVPPPTNTLVPPPTAAPPTAAPPTVPPTDTPAPPPPPTDTPVPPPPPTDTPVPIEPTPTPP